jgi:hypothetical protein
MLTAATLITSGVAGLLMHMRNIAGCCNSSRRQPEQKRHKRENTGCYRSAVAVAHAAAEPACCAAAVAWRAAAAATAPVAAAAAAPVAAVVAAAASAAPVAAAASAPGAASAPVPASTGGASTSSRSSSVPKRLRAASSLAAGTHCRSLQVSTVCACVCVRVLGSSGRQQQPVSAAAMSCPGSCQPSVQPRFSNNPLPANSARLPP